MDFLGEKIDGLEIDIETNVPRSGGLGSSATCIIGGVVGAYLLCDKDINDKEIIEICTSIEGHPDNIVPAYIGGMDEMRMYDGLRNDDWIVTEYNNQSSPATFSTLGAEEADPSSGEEFVPPRLISTLVRM